MQPLDSEKKILFRRQLNLSKILESKLLGQFEDMAFISADQCIVLFSESTLLIQFRKNRKPLIKLNPPQLKKVYSKSQRWILKKISSVLLFEWKEHHKKGILTTVTDYERKNQELEVQEDSQNANLVQKRINQHEMGKIADFSFCNFLLGKYFFYNTESFSLIQPQLSRMLKQQATLDTIQQYKINNNQFFLQKLNKQNPKQVNKVLLFPHKSKASICKVSRQLQMIVILVCAWPKNELIFFNCKDDVVVSRTGNLKGIDQPSMKWQQHQQSSRLNQSFNTSRRISENLSRVIDIETNHLHHTLVIDEFIPIKKVIMHLAVQSGIFQWFGKEIVRKVLQVI